MPDELVYCLKCKKKTVQENPEQITMKNDKPAMQGNCADCGTKTTRIMGSKAQAQA